MKEGEKKIDCDNQLGNVLPIQMDRQKHPARQNCKRSGGEPGGAMSWFKTDIAKEGPNTGALFIHTRRVNDHVIVNAPTVSCVLLKTS